MRIFLIFIFFIIQTISVPMASRWPLLSAFSESSEDHHHDSHSEQIDEDNHNQVELSFHDHAHRHSSEEQEHSHSHHHLNENLHVNYLVSGIAFQLNLFLIFDLVFPAFADQAVQGPFLSSVFRPPIA